MARERARKIYGIVLALTGLGVFIAAIGLAVAANEEPATAPKERLVLPKGRRRHRRSKRPRTNRISDKKPDKSLKPRAPLPRKRGIGLGSKTETAAFRPKIPINGGPTTARPVVLPGSKVETIKKVGPALTHYPTVTPGIKGLPAEERAKRRKERKQRQYDTLVRRIQSLEERIGRAKEGGRSPRAIERMEQSLDRMKQRRRKLEQALEDDR